MKKSSIVLCAFMALAGCTTGYVSDIDRASEVRAEHHEAYRQEFGCPLTDDHQAYRDCLLRTYNNTHPKTFKTSTNDEGKSVAIVKNETKTSYDKDTNTYKTERVIVIETEEKLVPVPAVELPVIPQEDIIPVKPTPDMEYEDEVIVEDTDVIEEPEIITEPEIAPEPAVTPEPEPQKTWWDTYQEEKTPEVAEPKCPCEDPNDPCPQCIDK